MSRARAENSIGKILDNILFLEQVFGDQADRDIPKLRRWPNTTVTVSFDSPSGKHHLFECARQQIGELTSRSYVRIYPRSCAVW